ncbi:MAG: ATP-binding protein, partial [Burkholderiaceae bacterium]
EQLDQIFAPFFTTKRDGLGLGLNICRTIVEAHGGSMTVVNEAEGGATFSFILPVAH